MATVKVDTTGIDSLINKLQRVSNIFPGAGTLSPILKSTLDRIGDKILKDVQKETPVGDSTNPGFHEGSQFHTDKTHLRDSWRWKLKIRGVLVEGYTHVTTDKLDDLIDLLEAGSPRHSIVAKPGSVLRFYARKGGGWETVYTKVVDHPGFPANKFTDKAQHKVDTYIKELVSVLQSEINHIILRR